MRIKSPFADVSLDFDSDLCSKTVADDQGKLETGYVATCPETKKQFEVQVVITGVGPDSGEATITTAPLPAAAVLAQTRNAVADKARKAAGSAAEKKAGDMIDVVMLSMPPLPNTVPKRLKGTVAAALVAQAAEAPLTTHDAKVKKALATKAVADKKLASAAIARAGG